MIARKCVPVRTLASQAKSARHNLPHMGRLRVQPKAANLRVRSSGQLVDRYVPPRAWFAPRAWLARLQNLHQTFLWSNRVRRALRDHERERAGFVPTRVAPTRRLAMALQLHLPMPLAALRRWSARRFARRDAAQLYAQATEAEALGDRAALRSLAAEQYLRAALARVAARRAVPAALALEATCRVRRAKLISVRTVLNVSPPIEYAQVLVRFDATHSVRVRERESGAVRSEETRDVRQFVAFERDLRRVDGRWLVLQTLTDDEVAQAAASPGRTMAAGAKRG